MNRGVAGAGDAPFLRIYENSKAPARSRPSIGVEMRIDSCDGINYGRRWKTVVIASRPIPALPLLAVHCGLNLDAGRPDRRV